MDEMSQTGVLPAITKPPVPTAKFACDFCRSRKLKCSRELPKCSNCQPWPCDCIYSHSKRRRRKIPQNSSLQEEEKLADRATILTQTAAPGSVDARLDRIEASIAQLTNTVNGLAQLVQTNSTTEKSSTQAKRAQPAESPPAISEVISQDPLHSIHALPQAISGLQSIKSRFPRLPQDLDPSNTLHDLTDSLAAVHFQHDKLRQHARMARGVGRVFYIPSKAEADAMIERLAQIRRVGYPMYLLPPVDLLPKIINEPWSVHERGWVVIFNCVMVGSIQESDQRWTSLKQELLCNTWLALDDSSLFLQPCLANILALLTVATQGADFTSPNLSWILIGHACRLAQAMNLHIPAANANADARNQQLVLFWGLFNIDKSVNMAFGRPAMMSSSFYKNVPLPEASFLANFTPHYLISASNRKGMPVGGPFGGVFFIQAVELAKVREKAADFSLSFKHLTPAAAVETKDALEKELLCLFKKTTKELTAIRDSEAGRLDSQDVHAMDTCIAAFQFKYHHLRVLINRLDAADQETCLCSAREAISTLGKLIKSSQLVYSGLHWQLFYFPFTPFFTLFGNIIRDPFAQTCTTDLGMLQNTVRFFKSLVEIGVAAHKPLKISSMFASLAQIYVQQSLHDQEAAVKQKATRHSVTTSVALDYRDQEYRDQGLGHQEEVQKQHLSTNAWTNSTASPTSGISVQAPPSSSSLFSAASKDVSPDEVLNWFDANKDTMEQTGEGPMQWPHPAFNDQLSQFWSESDPILNSGGGGGGSAATDTLNILGSFVSKGRKRPLECDFDWITWDFLNSSSSSNS